MNICDINTNPLYLRMLKCVSAKDASKLNTIVSMYVDKYGEMPLFDEISFIDSTLELKDALDIKKSSQNTLYTSIQNILRYTNKETIDEAVIALNSYIHPDLNISLFPLGATCVIDIKRRPSINRSISNETVEIDTSIDAIKNKLIISNMIYNLQKKLGINFILITNEELSSDAWSNILGDSKGLNAFIYNGDIYINIDNANLDAPLHELSHILIGNIRFINPLLYLNLLLQVMSIKGINRLLEQYDDRTMNDRVEEVFVTEFSKYLCNYKSIFDSLGDYDLHMIDYYMRRCLDTMLQGDYSVKNISSSLIGFTTLASLGKLLLAHCFNNKRANYDFSYLHRSVNNLKSKLLKKGDLIEECD